ncbi:glycine zipper family protein [Shimia thalassica]|uniref:glycine zipper family protein n=1 Tax=Shimia thalassica TaxID=1715693 RepID=UPI00273299B9|nr:glycine zipper family protein [Shimia thalassica]MDP2517075.1 glycine zipper family protein [Shimia thalassica]
MKTLFALIPLVALAACSGTGASHQPVLSTKSGPTYEADLSTCQSLAKSQPVMSPDTKTTLAKGATIGALVGLADDGVSSAEGLAAGAVAGLIGGGLSAEEDVRSARKAIVVQCLRDKGHPVVG